MSMINSSSFNKKIKTIFFLTKLFHCEFCHISKTRFIGVISLTIDFIFQIVIGKQADYFIWKRLLYRLFHVDFLETVYD